MKVALYKVWRNGELLGANLTEAEADEMIADNKEFDRVQGAAWGYSNGRYHKTAQKKRQRF